jgi:ribosome-associated toxin RatA of RatAB toxin-antitoxin module
MSRHEEQATLAYGAEGLFTAVEDVKDYPSFVPWCNGAHVRREDQRKIIADLIIGVRSIPRKLHVPGHAGPTTAVASARHRGAAGAPNKHVHFYAGRR